MSAFLRDKTAIVGIGATEFSTNSGRSEMQLACEAVMAALADAGLSPSDVDGMSTYMIDGNPEIEIFRNIGGKDLKFFSRTHFGGGGTCSPLLQAAMAITCGVAEVVVCYRAMNERSQYRFGKGIGTNYARQGTFEAGQWSWYTPFGLSTATSWAAMTASRYMHDFGATSEDFGRVTVAFRKHAATNPKAWFYKKPITLEDHQASRWIFRPLHMLDCCLDSDGGIAVVVTSAERAKDLKQKPALIRAVAQGACDQQESMVNFYREEIHSLSEMRLVAEQLYRTAGLGPEDVQTACLYDHFSAFVLPQLEVLGFCERGEAKDFIRDGNIEIGGRLPVNTHGGQLGEAYVHGLNGIAEAVRQIRGTAANQLSRVENVLVTAATGVPTSAAILSAV